MANLKAGRAADSRVVWRKSLSDACEKASESEMGVHVGISAQRGERDGQRVPRTGAEIMENDSVAQADLSKGQERRGGKVGIGLELRLRFGDVLLTEAHRFRPDRAATNLGRGRGEVSRKGWNC